MRSLAIILIALRMVAAYGQTASPAPKAPAAETVFVLGEVLRSPGILAYVRDLTLRGAISSAGGVNEWNSTPIYIIRDGAIFLKTSTKNVFRKTPPDDPKLKPKDVVYLGFIGNAK